jgi:hypothetical protein
VVDDTFYCIWWLHVWSLEINYRSSAGRGSCVFVGGGGRELASYRATREPGRSENLFEPLLAVYTEQAAA